METTAKHASETWHALDSQTVLDTLHSTPQGLDSGEIPARLERYGRNELPEQKPRSALRRFLAQLNNALILLLIAAAILALVLGHVIDAAVIAAVVVVNAFVGFAQEGRAEQALHALRAMLAPRARVLRDGQRQEIDVGELVPGDVVLLEAGDRVPADLRLLRVRGMLIDEAALTGESVAVAKEDVVAESDASLGDRSGMAYSSTLVAAGQATGVVVATGERTEIGRISGLLSSVETLTTPLLRKINQFGSRFTVLALVAAGLLLAFAILVRDFAWIEGLMVVVAVTVSAVPASLPAVITITLAIGVQRMARRHAIIRRLPAVETLGSTTVICSDKTGTLTRNEMTAVRLVGASGTVSASGSGYAPDGELSAPPDAAQNALVDCGLYCNDAALKQSDEGWHVDGDPMEGALLALAMKAGRDTEQAREARPRLDEIPFDAEHRFMATLHGERDGDGVALYVKGAPERVLAMCDGQFDAEGKVVPLDHAYWEAAIAESASAGERVLGFATAQRAQRPDAFDFDQVKHLTLAGVIGFIDPPRAEARLAVADCRSAGISVKMITGDHAATAQAIAGQLGLADDPQVLTGHELEAISDADLPEHASRASVFARTSPEHKLRVVRALQSRGDVVAMTGDGVNDAPALKRADVGVAMGDNGTEAAKEASEMVLTDDNFASIVAAVHEGRTVYDNIRKVVAWTLPTNGGEMLIIVAAILLGLALPMTAVQILWVNMVLTITLGLVLAFEPAEPGVMRRPPQPPNAPLISPFMLWRVILVSLLFAASAFGVFNWAISRGLELETARTMVVNMLCVMEIVYLFNVRYLHSTSFSLRGLLGTPAVVWAVGGVIVAQLAFTYLPWMHGVFETGPVPLFEGLVILAVGAVMLVLLEIEKTVLRRLDLFDELRAPAPEDADDGEGARGAV